jgi:hypothetical protein
MIGGNDGGNDMIGGNDVIGGNDMIGGNDVIGGNDMIDGSDGRSLGTGAVSALRRGSIPRVDCGGNGNQNRKPETRLIEHGPDNIRP